MDQADASRDQRTVSPLRTAGKQAPVGKAVDWKLYETVSNPEIDVDKLTHFGIGVFYKGAVHSWNNGTSEPYMKLASEEQEALRQYLLGLPTCRKIWCSV